MRLQFEVGEFFVYSFSSLSYGWAKIDFSRELVSCWHVKCKFYPYQRGRANGVHYSVIAGPAKAYLEIIG